MYLGRNYVFFSFCITWLSLNENRQARVFLKLVWRTAKASSYRGMSMMNTFLFVFKSDSCLCLEVIKTVAISSSSVLLRGLKKLKIWNILPETRKSWNLLCHNNLRYIIHAILFARWSYLEGCSFYRVSAATTLVWNWTQMNGQIVISTDLISS